MCFLFSGRNGNRIVFLVNTSKNILETVDIEILMGYNISVNKILKILLSVQAGDRKEKHEKETVDSAFSCIDSVLQHDGRNVCGRSFG